MAFNNEQIPFRIVSFKGIGHEKCESITQKKYDKHERTTTTELQIPDLN